MRKLYWILPGMIMALLCCLPLSWVAPIILPAQLTSGKTGYQGTIWRGQISHLTDIERVNFTLNPLNILVGRMPIQTDLSSPGLQANARLSSQSAETLNLRINVANLPLPDPRLSGLAGQITSQIDHLAWTKDGACKTARGTAQSDILARNESLFSWTGPDLAGPVSCNNNGDYLFVLTGQDSLQTIQADISISARGSYQSDITVITRDEDAASVLPLFGFENRGRGEKGIEFRLVEQGNWR